MAKTSQSNEKAAAIDTKKSAPYGGWLSPIDAATVAGSALRLSQATYDLCEPTAGPQPSLYFLEGRPSEGGRQVIVVRGSDGLLRDINSSDGSVRTLVHEYGGGAFSVHAGLVFYTNYGDQRVYVTLAQGGNAIAISPAAADLKGHSLRFADYAVDSAQQRVFAVMEDHTAVQTGNAPEPINCIVALSYREAAAALRSGQAVDVAAHNETSQPLIVASGADFYACPRLSPDGRRLAFIRWTHPNLPWDDSELVVCDLSDNGAAVRERVVAGGKDCSVFQPQWGADGKLYFVSDQSGFWNIYCLSDFQQYRAHALIPAEHASFEFGQPMWVFGQSTYVVVNEKLIICAVNRHGLWSLARLEMDWPGGAHRLNFIESPYTDISSLNLGAGRVAMIAASADRPSAVVEYFLADDTFVTVKSSAASVPDSAYLSRPQVIEFPTENNQTAFAFYYPPTNKDYTSSGAPPLLVKCHGGPTGAASSALSLGLQFWTSRGFAVVDVNYGGSTGFGRAYRKRLNGKWGIVDVDDCVNAVKYLVKEGLADGERVTISGGSAGGYTVLCGLAFKDVFKAGASHYGIGDLEALVRDTHKFEARYLDNLVGAYPQDRHIYFERSPINHIDKLKCPVIFFQGLDDKVVPPNQAEAMVEALNAKNIPVAYIAYEGEQHGFRQAANIIRTLESELYFFRRVFNIDSDEKLAAVVIHNLEEKN